MKRQVTYVLLISFFIVIHSLSPENPSTWKLDILSHEGISFLSNELLPDIPPPDEILGYSIGERFSDYRNVEGYTKAVANSSNRVLTIDYGVSYEHRPLRVFVISSPENLSQLETITESIRKLADPRKITPAEVENIISTSPVIVWLAYGVHGNEASATEAALITLYYLAASTNSEILNILDETIIIIDPLVNPDGRERYVQYINSRSQKQSNKDPHSLEHEEPWPRGRTNHYYFDLNRDWAWLTQQETCYRLKLYQQFMPQVYVDYHEMGRESTYFFFPATSPIHPNYPKEVKRWGEIFGNGNANIFDKFGIPYYTGEIFDLFYPGYGDSYPTYNGAIGMTYEQAAGGAGRAYRRRDGDVLTLTERAHNHFLTGIATVKTAHTNRKELLRYFYSFWKNGIEDTKTDRKSFIIEPGSDPNKTADMINKLLSHGIEVHKTESEIRVNRAIRFFEQSPKQKTFPAGTYIIPLDQPKSRLALTLLEPHAELNDTSTYDITAWALPAAFNVDAYWSPNEIRENLRKINDQVTIGGNILDDGDYAYLIPWDRLNAAIATWQILERGYKGFYASRPFTQNARNFKEGTAIFFIRNNPPQLKTEIEQIAHKYGIDIVATPTGRSESGIDLGSNFIHPLIKPSIAVLSDVPTIPGDYGEIWYLFDEVLEIPFTPIRTQNINRIDLSDYDVIIMPSDGTGNGYNRIIDSTAVQSLNQWIRSGGTLITIGGASIFAGKKMSELTNVLLVHQGEKTEEMKKREEERIENIKRMGFRERIEFRQRDVIAGAIFRVKIDTTHPLAFGYKNEIPILKRGTAAFQLSNEGYNVGIFSRNGLLSGYAAHDRIEQVTDTAYLIDIPQGDGRIILFTENLHYRMFWKGLTKLFINACLYFNY